MILTSLSFAWISLPRTIGTFQRPMSTCKPSPRVVLLTGGSWWGSSSPENIGHHFIRHVFRNTQYHDFPLKLYIGTRSKPPEGELAHFIAGQIHSRLRTNPESLDAKPEHVDVSLHHLPLDLLNPDSIRNCALEFLSQEARLDVLILNAAIAPNGRESTGFIIPHCRAGESDENVAGDFELETGMMTNVVGTAMLTKLLEPALLKDSERSEERDRIPRIVLVSSELHRRLGGLEGPIHIHRRPN
ncbi:hypothetical protein QFC19_008914 [Naganishia cerealis]|uniref:Uncharacterized protein n=1 Tax=Naganishia cerealis TaxID=610337 RepID=A0ACC2UYG6_9TREE|nr:hypothetical protein QFC19_008914 [Naganishia cerealis]